MMSMMMMLVYVKWGNHDEYDDDGVYVKWGNDDEYDDDAGIC